MVVAPICEGKVEGAIVLHNGEQKQVAGLEHPGRARVQHRPQAQDGTPYHPKGEGNGYVLTFGDTRVYIAGDTENVPEMKALQNIAVAFLPMNLPYTMTPEMVADAARAFRPRDPLPVPLRRHRPEHPRRAAQGRERDRGAGAEHEVKGLRSSPLAQNVVHSLP